MSRHRLATGTVFLIPPATIVYLHYPLHILDDSTVVSIVDELLHVSNLPSAAVSGNVKDYLSITTITTAGKHSLVTPAVKTWQQRAGPV